jgi:hypothetical protein
MPFCNICGENIMFAGKIGIVNQNAAIFCQILTLSLVPKKIVNVFAENWPKSAKIIIFTLTPGNACI